jgi:hypothetical protein
VGPTTLLILTRIIADWGLVDLDAEAKFARLEFNGAFHVADAQGDPIESEVWPNLANSLARCVTLRSPNGEAFDNSVRNGKNQMPPWKGVLSDEEIDQVWHYIRAHANKK